MGNQLFDWKRATHEMEKTIRQIVIELVFTTAHQHLLVIGTAGKGLEIYLKVIIGLHFNFRRIWGKNLLLLASR